MTESSKTQRSSFRLSMLLITLGMCVFFWGLGYKLSLYKSHGPTMHRIPEAKLLSRNEDPNARDSTLLCLSSNSQQPEPVLIAAVMAAALANSALNRDAAGHYVEVEPPTNSRFQASLTAIFFRPPPSSL